MVFRPQEVSDWIKSKKKDLVPPVTPAHFDDWFTKWWTMLQPGWWKDNVRSIVTLVLFRDIPEGETWQGLRKGGTAGIYVIIMALSWWIKAQQTERNPEAWSSVDDVLWVLEHMNQMEVSHTPAPKKRARDEGRRDKAEGQQRKRSV